VRLRRLGGLGGRPHTHGLAFRFSCRVATLAAWSISKPSAKSCPAKACRLNSRHHTSMRFSHAAPFGMKACSILGCPSSHSLTSTLLWVETLSHGLKLAAEFFGYLGGSRAACNELGL
jgi:hypothetical protein